LLIAPVEETDSPMGVKANLICIVDRQPLEPESGDGPNHNIIPALLFRPAVSATTSAAMVNQAPEFIGITPTVNKPEGVQPGYGIPIYLEPNDSRFRSRSLPRNRPSP
jgi:hypothetical protein